VTSIEVNTKRSARGEVTENPSQRRKIDFPAFQQRKITKCFQTEPPLQVEVRNRKFIKSVTWMDQVAFATKWRAYR
jgi:hypothetical protein